MSKSKSVQLEQLQNAFFNRAPANVARDQWLPAAIFHAWYRRRHPKESRADRRHREYYEQAPKPLKLRSCRASPLRFGPTQIDAAYQRQTGNRLLNLPREIRELIYSYAVASDQIVHVVYNPRAVPGRLIGSHHDYPSHWEKGQRIRWHENQAACVYNGTAESKPINFGLSFMRTCRQVYHETLPMLYTNNTFSFSNIDNLIFLSKAIPTPWMHSIRYLQVIWNISDIPFSHIVNDRLEPFSGKRPYDMETWKSFWAVIVGGMTGLMELDVHISTYEADFTDEHMWLRPLAGLRGLKRFILQVVYFDMHAMEDDPAWKRRHQNVLAYRKEIKKWATTPRYRQLWRPRSFDKKCLNFLEEKSCSKENDKRI
ncbi:hypothetical protein MMC25_001925 [Agyrium rufum]|nr:hypothetical protein [Agyrium rufum]